MRTALKLSATGNTAELLTFLQALFNSQNLEISSVDRVHLSNLSLLCQLHQLCSGSLVSKYYLEEKLLFFLRSNKWYDSCLAIRQCVEVGSWKLLSGVSLTLGLEAELGQALLLYNIDNIVRRSGDQEMLSLLLSPHLLPALLDCPSAGVSLVSTLTRLLLLLSSSQLNTLLHNTCPVRLDYILDLPPENR